MLVNNLGKYKIKNKYTSTKLIFTQKKLNSSSELSAHVNYLLYTYDPKRGTILIVNL